MTDEQFFKDHPDRFAHIRKPDITLVTTSQRGQMYLDECEREFTQLGSHRRERRRILVWRVPKDNPWYDPQRQPLLKIPFLAFADETIEDDDATLLPIIHEIMTDARARV